MNRREFLRGAGVAALGATVTAWARTEQTEPVIMSVRGPVKLSEIGSILPHEHVLVDFVGADRVNADRYDRDDVFEVALPYLQEARDAGLGALADCTPAYLGRDPVLLKRLSAATGLHILTNTGLYGAAGDKFVPAHAYEASAESLCEAWTREWKNGIGETGIRPGFIKTAVDPGPLSGIDAKLIRAAALTHHETGLCIASHTTDAESMRAELAILNEESVPPDKFIWVHAHSVADKDVHLEAAERGIWVSFDGLSEKSVDRYLNLVKNLRDAGYLDQVLVSHDAGWYSVGEENGGSFQGFTTFFDAFVPAMKEAGLSEDEIAQISKRNPARAFALQAA